MCGILGAINTSEILVKQVAKNLLYRGRDGVGVMYKRIFSSKRVIRKSLDPYKILNSLPQNFTYFLANARAIPTTEFQTGADWDASNQQPFTYKNFTVVHNGVIANDKELISKFNLKPSSPVDTAILPELIKKIGILKTSRVLKGSFSILAFDSDKNILFGIKNFTPMVYLKTNPGILITSIPKMIPQPYRDEVRHVPPYSMFYYLPKEDRLYIYPFLSPTNKKKSVLVICSSGIDSVTTAWVYKHFGYEVNLIHFKYGQAAEKTELYCVKKLAKHLKAKLIVYDAKSIFKPFKQVSRLLSCKTSSKASQMWDSESTFSYVPNRNAIFAMIAAGVAEMLGCSTVAFGGQQMDSAYPDNNPDFVRTIDSVLPYSLNWNSNIKFSAPLIHLIKHEIVEIGNFLQVPYQYVCSCYYPEIKNGKPLHCGTCGCCQYRYSAFKMLKLKDPVDYKRKIRLKGNPFGSRIKNKSMFLNKYVAPFL